MYADRKGLITISTTFMLQNVMPFSFSIDLLLIIALWETGSQVFYCQINVLSKLEQINTIINNSCTRNYNNFTI